LEGHLCKHLLIKIQSGLRVTGNRHLLAQTISNLLDNAIKYTRAGGNIKLEATCQEQGLFVQIHDNGSGIPVDQHVMVLQRFVRLDAARSTPGSGLGVSLVKAVVEFHNSTFKLKDNQPGLKIKLFFSMASTIESGVQYPLTSNAQSAKMIIQNFLQKFLKSAVPSRFRHSLA
jgi:signal transduction histidine kinase